MIHSLLFSDFWPIIITTFMFMAIMGFIATSLDPYNPESLKSYTIFTILFTVSMGISLIIPNSLLYKYRPILKRYGRCHMKQSNVSVKFYSIPIEFLKLKSPLSRRSLYKLSSEYSFSIRFKEFLSE